MKEYVRELTGFPGTKHDDQVDSTTQLLDYVDKHRPLIITQEMLDRAAQPGPYRRRRLLGGY